MTRIVVTFFCVFGILPVCALNQRSDSLRYEVLLTTKMLNNINVNEKFISSIDFTSNQLILLSTPNQFYLLGWGGILPVGAKNTKRVNSFSYTSNGQLLVICQNEICYVDSLGNLSKLYLSPSDDMGITAGKKLMFVYDRSKEREKHSLYAIANSGKYERWLIAPKPITSVLEFENLLMFSTNNAIYSFNPQNKEIVALLKLEEKDEIISMSHDELNNIIYFSTQKAIYRLIKPNYRRITDSLGGTLKYFHNSLFVFDPEKKFLVRIVGIENQE